MNLYNKTIPDDITALTRHAKADRRMNWKMLNHSETNVLKVSVSRYKNLQILGSAVHTTLFKLRTAAAGAWIIALKLNLFRDMTGHKFSGILVKGD